MDTVFVKVPATSANLGPGFDCLGVALSLWNMVYFEIGGEGLQIMIEGEGAGSLPINHDNTIVQSAMHLYQSRGEQFPENIKIHCENNIPLGSGLGSSSAAILCGLVGANKLLGETLSQQEVLKMGVEIEGHPDNIAPALLGGLVISSIHDAEVITAQVSIPEWTVLVVLPAVELSTAAARAALPINIPLIDAVENIGNTALLIQALQSSDIDILRVAMSDKLHQPYRLPLIPGAQNAIKHANQMGGAAALSGAGPSIIVFTKDKTFSILNVIEDVFDEQGIAIRRTFQLTTI